MKKLIKILFAACAVLTICSCAAKQENEVMSADFAMNENVLQRNRNEQEANNLETAERKIIKLGGIRFQTADINKTKSLILQRVQELNGYISNDYEYDYADRLEHSLTIRVPADKFDLLLTKISESIDKLDSKNIDVLDVTEEYLDVEARIKTKKELQNRYMELLKRAAKVDEMLSIEKEIGNLQTEIESVEGRMKYLKDRIAFSTLTATYYQKSTSKFGFASKFVNGIKSGWSVFLWFIVGLSHLWVFIFIAIATTYLIIRQQRKRKKKSVHLQP